MEIVVVLSMYYLSGSCNVLLCIAHLIIPKILCCRYHCCYHPTREERDAEKAYQEHAARKSQCWDLVPGLLAPAL